MPAGPGGVLIPALGIHHDDGAPGTQVSQLRPAVQADRVLEIYGRTAGTAGLSLHLPIVRRGGEVPRPYATSRKAGCAYGRSRRWTACLSTGWSRSGRGARPTAGRGLRR